MKKYLFLMVLMAAASCSSIEVSSDHDKTADFSSYKTYAFTNEALNLPVNDLDRKRLMDALESSFASKGLTKSSTGDLWVDLKLTAEQKQQATATNTGGYGMGYAYRWGGGFSTTTINVENYVEGTLFVDFIDASKKQLVWQGRGTRTLDPNASADKREQRIKEAVAAIMKQYPPAIKK